MIINKILIIDYEDWGWFCSAKVKLVWWISGICWWSVWIKISSSKVEIGLTDISLKQKDQKYDTLPSFVKDDGYLVSLGDIQPSKNGSHDDKAMIWWQR